MQNFEIIHQLVRKWLIINNVFRYYIGMSYNATLNSFTFYKVIVNLYKTLTC